jgi:hypothetical protein
LIFCSLPPLSLHLSITRFFLIAIYRRFYLNFSLCSIRLSVCVYVSLIHHYTSCLSVFLAISGYPIPIVLRSNSPFSSTCIFSLSLSRTYNGYRLPSTTYLRRFFSAIYRFDHLLQRPQRPLKSTNCVIYVVICLPYRLLLPRLPTSSSFPFDRPEGRLTKGEQFIFQLLDTVSLLPFTDSHSASDSLTDRR